MPVSPFSGSQFKMLFFREKKFFGKKCGNFRRKLLYCSKFSGKNALLQAAARQGRRKDQPSTHFYLLPTSPGCSAEERQIHDRQGNSARSSRQ
jgi:hypothetical protein